MATPYEVLGIAPSSNLPEIHSAYRQRAKALHPDRGGDAEAFKRLALAYEALKVVPTRRATAGPALMVWLNVGGALTYAFVAAVCFVGGDRPEGYNGWLVGFGWISALLAWRAFADRKQRPKNPIRSLIEAISIISMSAVLLGMRLAAMMALLFGVLGLLSLAEWLIKTSGH